MVRNDFKWLGQGWAPNDGNSTDPSNFRSTLVDRDYAGVNTHVPPGSQTHVGTVVNAYTPPVIGNIGRVHAHVEIAL